MQTGLTLYQKARSVSCLHHSHLSCTTSNTLQAPHPLGSWACPDRSISSGTAEHRAELALEPRATAVEQVTTGWLLHASRMHEHPAATQGHFPQSDTCFTCAAAHHSAWSGCHRATNGATCWEGEWGQSQILNWTLHA